MTHHSVSSSLRVSPSAQRFPLLWRPTPDIQRYSNLLRDGMLGRFGTLLQRQDDCCRHELWKTTSLCICLGTYASRPSGRLVNERRNWRDTALGSFIIVCLVLPHIYWISVSYSNVVNWQFALWAFVTGAVCFLSFFFREKTFLFRSILWVLRTHHIPPGEWLAIVYGILFFVIGAYYLAA